MEPVIFHGTPMTPLELADACEKAMGPDRELDAAIFRAIGSPLPTQFGPMGISLEWDADGVNATVAVGDMQVRFAPPTYTASLDAAMTLVPEGWEWTINTFANPKKASAYLVNAADDMVRPRKQYQATPALALCAASLRAIDNGEQKDG